MTEFLIDKFLNTKFSEFIRIDKVINQIVQFLKFLEPIFPPFITNLYKVSEIKLSNDHSLKKKTEELLNIIEHSFDFDELNLKSLNELKCFVQRSSSLSTDLLAQLTRVANHVQKSEANELFSILFKMTAKRPQASVIKSAVKLKKIVQKSKLVYSESKKLYLYMEEDVPVAKHKSQDSANGLMSIEKGAADLDLLLGSPFVPLSIPVLCTREKNVNQIQSLAQLFLHGAITLEDLLKTERGQLCLNDLPVSHVHAYLVFNLIRGRSDGHLANTLLHKGRLFDIDEENDFPFTNRQLSYTSTQELSHFCKIPLLGLNHANIPFSKAMLALFSTQNLTKRVEVFLKYKKLDEPRKLALLERVKMIQTLMAFEFNQEKSTLTPRDLYHFLHGKEELYRYIKKRGVNDFSIFRHLHGWEDRQADSFYRFLSGLDHYIHLKDSEINEEWQMKERDPISDIYYQLVTDAKATIQLEHFDVIEWNKYKENHDHDFMISRFSTDTERCVLRKLRALYPTCKFVVDESKCLTLIKDPFFQKVSDGIHSLNRGEMIMFTLQNGEVITKNGRNSLRGQNRWILEWINPKYKFEIGEVEKEYKLIVTYGVV